MYHDTETPSLGGWALPAAAISKEHFNAPTVTAPSTRGFTSTIVAHLATVILDRLGRGCGFHLAAGCLFWAGSGVGYLHTVGLRQVGLFAGVRSCLSCRERSLYEIARVAYMRTVSFGDVTLDGI